jgi:hypothetical protein
MLPKNLLCFSPIRWDFTMYRPQQLLVRFAEDTNVYFFEEPVFDAVDGPFLTYSTRSETLWKLVPHLLPQIGEEQINASLGVLLDGFLMRADLQKWTFWYYTHGVLPFTEKYKPRLVIYDRIVGGDDNADWNDVFLSVSQQIKNKLPLSTEIALLP